MSITSAPSAALTTGTWDVDVTHSEVSFVVRHMMVSKVRGRFERFSGVITAGDTLADMAVEATIEVASVTTGLDPRDEHIRSNDFFGAEAHPTMTFRSTGLVEAGDAFALTGDLTLKGVTKAVTLQLEFNGVSPDPWGGTRAGFTASGEISRNDFGVDLHMPMDGGGVVVGDKVKIELEIEALLRQG